VLRRVTKIMKKTQSQTLQGSLAIVVAVAVWAVPARRAVACQPQQMDAEVFEPIAVQTEVARSGAVVVAEAASGLGIPTAPVAAVSRPETMAAPASRALTIAVANITSTPTIVPLAPGLALWRVKLGKAATIDLKWGEGNAASLKVVADGPALPAVRLRIAASSTAQISRAELIESVRYGTPPTTLALRLQKTLPKDAVALVLYQRLGKHVEGITWMPFEPEQTEFMFNGGGKNCGRGVPGIYIGDRIEVRYVTRRGRLSPATAARASKLTDAMAETFMPL
jgi:hypothetical protein